MPGSTIHLMFANMIDENAPIEYFAGSILIDAVDDYHLKDKTHFRKRDDRFSAMCEYFRTLSDTQFNRGIMTHLYLDWRWDSCELNRFIEEYGDGWFVPYRADIARLSRHFSNSVPWIRELWQRLYDLPTDRYGEIPMATTEDARRFMENGYASLSKPSEPTKFFHPDQAEHFLKMAALEYPQFIAEHIKCKK